MKRSLILLALSLLAANALATGYEVINVKDYMAKGNTIKLTDGVATASSTTFTSATASFISADVNKTIYIQGAGATGSISGCSMTALDYHLTCNSGSFASTDPGKLITVVGAGPGGTDLTTAIQDFTDSSHVYLQTAAVTTVSGTTASTRTFQKTTISAVTDAHTVTLAAASSSSQNPATFLYGDLDTTFVGNARASANASHGIVYFPPGNYLIDGSQVIDSGVEYRGAGMGQSVLYHAPGLKAGFLAPHYSTTSHLVFNDFTIDGSYPIDIHPNPEIDLSQGSDDTVQRVEVQNSGAAGVLCSAVNSHVSFNRLNGLGLPYLGGTQGIVFSDASAKGNLILSNTIKDYRLSGIYGWGTHHTIQGNYVENCHRQSTPTGGGEIALGQSLYATSSMMNSIIGNTIIGTSSGTATSGIEADGRGVTIMGNVIEGVALYGIVIQAGDNWSVSGNVIKNGGNTGIYVKGTDSGDTPASTAKHFSISGNHVFDDQGTPTQQWGIKIQSGLTVDDYVISNNILSGNINPGISEGSTGTHRQVFGNVGAASTLMAVYGQFTNESNYSRMTLSSKSGFHVFSAENAGTGESRGYEFDVGNGTPTWLIRTAGILEPGSNNAYDIGISGSNNVRAIYTAQVVNEVQTVAGATGLTINMNSGSVIKITLGANTSISSLSNLKSGYYTFLIAHDATATTYTFTYPSTMKFPGGTSYTPTQTANAVDKLVGTSDGTNVYFSAPSQDVK